jgi:hypothetical protein
MAMSGAMRQKDSADYDLERFVEMFDTALTSDDPRVMNALRQLMMMVILTSNEHEEESFDRRHKGPLRRMQQDLNDLARSTMRLTEELQSIKNTVELLRSRQSSGFRAQDYSNQAQTAKEYFEKQYHDNSTVARNISATDLRDLNIKINSGVLPGGK